MGSHVKSSICDVPYNGLSKSTTVISNNTAVMQSVDRMLQQFSALWKGRKSFFHWYKAEGMLTEEFEEAYANVGDLREEYKQMQEGDKEALFNESPRTPKIYTCVHR